MSISIQHFDSETSSEPLNTYRSIRDASRQLLGPSVTNIYNIKSYSDVIGRLLKVNGQARFEYRHHWYAATATAAAAAAVPIVETQLASTHVPIVDIGNQSDIQDIEVPIVDIGNQSDIQDIEVPIVDIGNQSDIQDIEVPIVDIGNQSDIQGNKDTSLSTQLACPCKSDDSKGYISLSITGGGIVDMRPNDGYINATKMCQSCGKNWFDYSRLDSTALFITALNPHLLYPACEVRRGRTGGAWVHHRLAIHLAIWISPDYAVAVTDLVERYLTGKLTTKSTPKCIESISNPKGLLAGKVPPMRSCLYFANVLHPRSDLFMIQGEIVGDKHVLAYGYTMVSARDRFDKQNAEVGGYVMVDCILTDYPLECENELKGLLKYNDMRRSGVCTDANGKTTNKTEFFTASQAEYAEIHQHMTVFAAELKTDRIDKMDSKELDIEKEKTKQIELAVRQSELAVRQSELAVKLKLLDTFGNSLTHDKLAILFAAL
jgi:hypothetical protein